MTEPDSQSLAVAALDWLVAQGQRDGAMLFWTTHPDDDELDSSLYSGAAGAVLALLEAHSHLGDRRYAAAALAGARGLTAALEEDSSSLYFGLTGVAFALHAVARRIGDGDCARAAADAMRSVREHFDGERWSDQFELLGGNAGIALGALAVDDTELAELAVEPYLTRWDKTAGGVNWEVRVGTAARFHHLAHGTLGIVHALASVGDATGRDDLLDLALAGAADVVSRNEAAPDGFLVPHSDPQHSPQRTERYNYGWCHGPAGDAQTFRLLAQVTGDEQWSGLADRCWHTVVDSGLPRRIRPGFWDNSGRCCGTAGVLALALDREAEGLPTDGFTDVLVADLAHRATIDDAGARWSNVEHRNDAPHLPPRTGWAMGNAGIVRELLRHARLRRGGRAGYAVPWPDHPAPSLS